MTLVKSKVLGNAVEKPKTEEIAQTQVWNVTGKLKQPASSDTDVQFQLCFSQTWDWVCVTLNAAENQGKLFEGCTTLVTNIRVDGQFLAGTF